MVCLRLLVVLILTDLVNFSLARAYDYVNNNHGYYYNGNNGHGGVQPGRGGDNGQGTVQPGRGGDNGILQRLPSGLLFLQNTTVQDRHQFFCIIFNRTMTKGEILNGLDAWATNQSDFVKTGYAATKTNFTARLVNLQQGLISTTANLTQPIQSAVNLVNSLISNNSITPRQEQQGLIEIVSRLSQSDQRALFTAVAPVLQQFNGPRVQQQGGQVQGGQQFNGPGVQQPGGQIQGGQQFGRPGQFGGRPPQQQQYQGGQQQQFQPGGRYPSGNNNNAWPGSPNLAVSGQWPPQSPPLQLQSIFGPNMPQTQLHAGFDSSTGPMNHLGAFANGFASDPDGNAGFNNALFANRRNPFY